MKVRNIVWAKVVTSLCYIFCFVVFVCFAILMNVMFRLSCRFYQYASVSTLDNMLTFMAFQARKYLRNTRSLLACQRSAHLMSTLRRCSVG